MRPIRYHGNLNRRGRKLKKILGRKSMATFGFHQNSEGFFADAARSLSKDYAAIAVGETSLKAVLGKPGAGMSYAMNDIIQNFDKDHPNAIHATHIDKGESFRTEHP